MIAEPVNRKKPIVVKVIAGVYLLLIIGLATGVVWLSGGFHFEWFIVIGWGYLIYPCILVTKVLKRTISIEYYPAAINSLVAASFIIFIPVLLLIVLGIILHNMADIAG